MKPTIYLAAPYSHQSKEIRVLRFEAANSAAAKLMKRGHVVFSPISHSHHIAFYLDNALDGNFWQRQDDFFLFHCDELVVLTMPGWRESKGVTCEVATARAQGMKVRYMDPETHLVIDAPRAAA